HSFPTRRSSDLLVVVKFNKIKAISDKIAALTQKLGLAQMNPDAGLADPLGKLEKEGGVTQGIDPNGDAAFVLLNGKMDQAKPPALLLIPVTDYKAFLGNFPGAKTEGDISTIHPKNDPKDSFVAQWGKYAVMSPTKEPLSKKPEGLIASGQAAKELDSKDICAFVNMKTARARLLPAIAKGRATIISEFEKGMNQAMTPPRGGARRGAVPNPAPGAMANAQGQKFAPLARAFIN